MSPLSALEAELNTPPTKPCIVGRFLNTLSPGERLAFDAGIDSGIPIDRARKVAKRHGYEGNPSSWHRHYVADCCCPTT